MNYFNYNGKLLRENTPVIGVNSRGLRYGDGLFETMKSIKGRILLDDEHFARLWKGMNMLQFNLAGHFTPDNLQTGIQELLKKNGHDDMARIRVTVLRGDGGLYDDINHNPNYIIQSWALPAGTGEWNSNGLVLGIYDDAKKNCDAFSSLKHNNFLPYAMAALHAKKQKWNDAVVLNNQGSVCDSSIANIFLVKDGLIHTPSLAEGCIAGIMRRTLLQYLAANNMQVVEGEISIDDLMNADEVFLTNSIYNIRWVQGIGEKKYSNALTQKIYTEFLPNIS